jgi:hypothetical protein
MYMHDHNAPRIHIPNTNYNNNNPYYTIERQRSLANMSFKTSMIDRIAGLKPGCTACGRKG